MDMTELINQTIGGLLAERVKESGNQEAVVYKERDIQMDIS